MLGNVKERQPAAPRLPTHCPSNGFPQVSAKEALRRTGPYTTGNESSESNTDKLTIDAKKGGDVGERTAVEADADAMLARMSTEQMHEALSEINSHLSVQSIQYLQSRRHQQQPQQEHDKARFSSKKAQSSAFCTATYPEKEETDDVDTGSEKSTGVNASDIRFDLHGQPIDTA